MKAELEQAQAKAARIPSLEAQIQQLSADLAAMTQRAEAATKTSSIHAANLAAANDQRRKLQEELAAK